MLKFFTKLISIFKKLYPVYWGIEPNKIKDKAYYQEEKTYTYNLNEKENVLFYAYPISFGKLGNIYVLQGDEKKNVTSEWKVVTLKENYLYTSNVVIDYVADYQFSRTYKFTYSSVERP